MTIGLSVLRAVIANSSRQAFRHLREDLFTDEELPAFRYITNYMSTYGALPSDAVLREQGFALTPAEGTLNYHIDRLQQRAVHRVAADNAEPFLAALRARDVVAVQRVVATMHDAFGRITTNESIVALSAAVQAVWDDYQEAQQHSGLRGVTTGFNVLDHVSGGFRPGDITTIAARPGVGKSWTIMYMAVRAWLAGSSAVFVSMEMTAIETARRIISMAVGPNPDHIMRGHLSEWAEQEVQQWRTTIPNLPPFNIMVGDLKKSTRDVDMLIQEFEPDIAYVDASYLMEEAKAELKRYKGKQWERAQAVAEELKGIAMNRNRHIVQTVQLGRGATQDEDGGGLEHISGSDAIGQITTLGLNIRLGAAPNERVRRRYRVTKNRHGIDWLTFDTNFLFDPFDMSVVGANINLDNEPADDEVDPMEYA